MVVKKVGERWCVMHCHGPEAGTPIKCFDTEAEAQAMHQAIEASKASGKAGFARFPNLETCKLEMKAIGHPESDAGSICNSILQRALNGVLLKANDYGLQVLSKAGDDEIVVGGYASWDIEDDQGDIFTVEAQSKALQRFLLQPFEFQEVTADHGLSWAKEFKLATPLLKYVNSKGEEFFTHVNEAGTYFISKLRNDNLKATRYFRQKARDGELNGYSVTALPLERDGKRVTDMEYHAITLTEKSFKPINPMTRDVKVISKSFQEVKESMKQTLEKASIEDIETELLDKYRARSALERLLYPPTELKEISPFPAPSEKPIPPDPATELLKQELRNKLDILRIEIYALEDALKQKIIAVNKANTPPKPTQKADLPTEKILQKHGFIHCRSSE